MPFSRSRNFWPFCVPCGIFSSARPSIVGTSILVPSDASHTVTGTRIRYWADRQIFVKDAEFDLEALRTRARQTAFLVPGLAIHRPSLEDIYLELIGHDDEDDA